MQISGAALLATAETANKDYEPGSASDTIFDDVNGIAALRDHIRQYPGRVIDNYLQTVSSESPNVYSALLAPPIIYGKGDGPINQRSTQIPELIKATLQRGKALQLGKGLNKWGHIHVHDLGTIISSLVKKAIGKDLSKGSWGDDGVYLTSVGEVVGRLRTIRGYSPANFDLCRLLLRLPRRLLLLPNSNRILKIYQSIRSLLVTFRRRARVSSRCCTAPTPVAELAVRQNSWAGSPTLTV